MLKFMTRIVTVLMFLGIMTGYTLAQYKDGDPPDNLLDEPIVEERMIWGRVKRQCYHRLLP